MPVIRSKIKLAQKKNWESYNPRPSRRIQRRSTCQVSSTAALFIAELEDIPESGGDRETVTKEGEVVNARKLCQSDSKAYGGIREMSVLDPAPGLGGFLKVVSIKVHPSPLSPQPPTTHM